MKDFVIYTVMVGGYDEIRQPLVVDDRFDYVLFTDKVAKYPIGVWRVLPINVTLPTTFLQSRYPKCLAEKVLPNYKASLYIDANIQITTSFVYEQFFKMIETDVEWGGVENPDKDCLYQEMNDMVFMQKVHDFRVVSWYKNVKDNKFPEHWGLFENNVIFRRHTDKITRINVAWWNTLLMGCDRDQFSLMYFLWKENPKQESLLPNGEFPRLNSTNFAYYKHVSGSQTIPINFHEKLRRRLLNYTYLSLPIKNRYKTMFDFVSSFRYPRKALFLWEFFVFAKYGYKYLFAFICRRMNHNIKRN